jgi:hypothetical protein
VVTPPLPPSSHHFVNESIGPPFVASLVESDT